MKTKRWAAVVLAVLMLCGCTKPQQNDEPAEVPTPDPLTADYSNWQQEPYYVLQFNVDSLISNASSIQTAASRVTITESAVYLLSGTLQNAQLIIDTAGPVTLVLRNVNMNYDRGPAVLVKNAEYVAVILEEESRNVITDGSMGQYNVPSQDAVIYSAADLIMTGSGELSITANYAGAIHSKGNIAVTGGSLAVTAPQDAVVGEKSLQIGECSLDITAGRHALVTTDTAVDSGTLSLAGGISHITAGCNGVQAAGSLIVSGGEHRITTGGGHTNASSTEGWGLWGGLPTEETPPSAEGAEAVITAPALPGFPLVGSAKGLVSARSISITDGTLLLDTSDDGISSNADCSISGGAVTVLSGDDGIHTAGRMNIAGGDLRISQCRNGLSAGSIRQTGGNVFLVTEEDGLHIAGGSVPAETKHIGDNRYLPAELSDYTLTDGALFIRSKGDGIDLPGSVTVTGGILSVYALQPQGYPVACGGVSMVHGGTVLLLGAAENTFSLSEYSAQHSFRAVLKGEGGTAFSVLTADGAVLTTRTAPQPFGALVYSSPGLQSGESYTVTSGSHSRTVTLEGISGGETLFAEAKAQ